MFIYEILFYRRRPVVDWYKAMAAALDTVVIKTNESRKRLATTSLLDEYTFSASISFKSDYIYIIISRDV